MLQDILMLAAFFILRIGVPLLLIGWGGIAALFYYSEPFVWARWGFFALWLTALTATAFPVIYFVTTRFSTEKLEPQVMVRRALWVGVYGAMRLDVLTAGGHQVSSAFLLVFGTSAMMLTAAGLGLYAGARAWLEVGRRCR